MSGHEAGTQATRFPRPEPEPGGNYVKPDGNQAGTRRTGTLPVPVVPPLEGGTGTGSEPGGAQIDSWAVVDLRPAPLGQPGWRAAFLTEDGCEVRSLVGWLVQERRDGVRRVVAATVRDVEVVPVEDDPMFWRVLAPEERNPSWDDAMTEHGRRVGLMEAGLRAAAQAREEDVT